jgi:hypothetical protein
MDTDMLSLEDALEKNLIPILKMDLDRFLRGTDVCLTSREKKRSTRVYGVLLTHGIVLVWQLIEVAFDRSRNNQIFANLKGEWIKPRNFAAKSLDLVEERLAAHGLRTGMTLEPKLIDALNQPRIDREDNRTAILNTAILSKIETIEQTLQASLKELGKLKKILQTL